MGTCTAGAGNAAAAADPALCQLHSLLSVLPEGPEPRLPPADCEAWLAGPLAAKGGAAGRRPAGGGLLHLMPVSSWAPCPSVCSLHGQQHQLASGASASGACGLQHLLPPCFSALPLPPPPTSAAGAGSRHRHPWLAGQGQSCGGAAPAGSCRRRLQARRSAAGCQRPSLPSPLLLLRLLPAGARLLGCRCVLHCWLAARAGSLHIGG